MTFAQHLARWEELHGVTASPLVVRWLRLIHAVARRLPVTPWVLTAAAVVLATLALAVPAPVAALLIVLSAVCDGLDGAVAVLRDRVTRAGAVLDAVGDRICDLLFLAVLVQAGASPWVAVAAAVAVLLLEGTRVVVRRPVAVTVGERPTRVIAVALGLVTVPTVGAVVLLVAVLVGLVQLALVGRRAPA